jgi:MFS family permease
MISSPFSSQIAGGIWADTVGGKTVLGFGVVWWSIATALTPVAAHLGLPFLLVVRAFMGIGEVSIDSYRFTVTCQLLYHPSL